MPLADRAVRARDDPGRLAAVESGSGPRLVLAHGFTQNAGTWGAFGDHLRIRHRLAAVDLPGHGRSSGVTAADLHDAARLLGATGGRAAYLGYSLGGRIALHTAIAHPELVERLVLIGATPGIADARERQQRQIADQELAHHLDPGNPGNPGDPIEQRARLEAFLRRWLAGPLFASLDADAAAFDARMANTCAGLASSLRTCGTGTQQPLWDRLPSLDMPVLVMAGERDIRFADIARRMVDAIGPNATVALVPDAGHACHLERPGAAAIVVEDFLARR